MKILIVEDSVLVQRMYSLVFPKKEHDLHTAENGRQALNVLAVETGSFDLILLDLRMPDMNGVEFIEEVRRQPRFNHTPIILTTAEPDGSELMIQARGLGVSAVVKKPWKPQELRDVVKTVLA